MKKFIFDYCKKLHTILFSKHKQHLEKENQITYINQTANTEYKDSDNLEENNCTIAISLTKDFNIDIIVYMNTNIDSPMTDIEYSMVCSDFLQACFTKNIQKQILNIVNKEIKNKNNLQFINSLNVICEYKTTMNSDFNTFIKPSQVFNYKLYNDK